MIGFGFIGGVLGQRAKTRPTAKNRLSNKSHNCHPHLISSFRRFAVLEPYRSSLKVRLFSSFRSFHSMTPSPPVLSSSFGLIGLGLIGNALAHRLRLAGMAVVGYDPDAAGAAKLADLGGQVVSAANEVLRQCDRVLLSLPSHKEVSAVLASFEGNWRPGQIILDTTTGDPAAAEGNAVALAAQGVRYLDATISGSSVQLRDGDGVWMVGGDKQAFDLCADLFGHLGKDVIYTGGPGTGTKMKLVTNLVLGLNRAALAEGLAFAKTLDLDLPQTLDTMRRGMAYSRMMDTKGDKMINQDFTPQARLSQHLKDVRLMLAASPIALPLSETHCQLLEKAEALGFGDLDNSAVLKAYEAPHS